jgi:predicted kinase
MTLYVLVGMIASGKSTYALKRADEGALVTSHDMLTNMLHARYRYEPGLRQCYRDMEEALVVRSFEHGRDAVIDRTHLTRESRERWIVFARQLDHWEILDRPRTQVVAVTFPIASPEEHARRRVAADPRGRTAEEWLLVARHHAEQAAAEPLDISEGFDGIIFEGFDQVQEAPR